MTTLVAEQLNMDDLIAASIARAQLQGGLIHRRDLPLAEVGACERLLRDLVRRGLHPDGLTAAAALVLRLETEAIDQRRDDRDHLPA